MSYIYSATFFPCNLQYGMVGVPSLSTHLQQLDIVVLEFLGYIYKQFLAILL